MKQKILTLMVALAAMLAGFSAKAVDYPLYVGGVRVTDENLGNITGPGITGAPGAVQYDLNTQTLILSDVTIKADAPIVSKLSSESNIRVCGSVSLECTSASGSAIENANTLNIIGVHPGDSLNVKSAGDGFYIRHIQSNLNFKKLNINLTAEKIGIKSFRASANFLSFDKVSLKANCKEAVIQYVSGIDFNNTKINSPENAAYNPDLQGLAVNGKLVSGVFETAWESGVTVAGIMVDGDNFESVTGPGITGGKIWYDRETETLVMENTSVKAETAVSFTKTNLLLKIAGTVNLESEQKHGIDRVAANYYEMNIVISGDGYETSVLNIKTPKIGINACASLDISDLTLNIESGQDGLNSRLAKGNVLTVENSAVTIKNNQWNVLAGFGNMVMDGCAVITPLGTYFDQQWGCLQFAETGAGVNGFLEIKPMYNIYIGETPVYKDNASNVTGKGITGGKISYDAEANILTLDNTVLDLQFNTSPRDVQAAVSSKKKDLQINIKGNVNVICSGIFGFNCLADTRIFGEPGSFLNIKTNNVSVKIEDSNVKFDGLNAALEQGIYGWSKGNGAASSVTFKNTNMTIDNKGHRAIDQINSLVFDGCKITNPEGAKLNTDLTKMYLEFNGEPVSYVEIKSDGTGVEGVTAEQVEDLNAPMFNVMGQQIAQPYNGQIYIQNGRKKVWRE